MCDLRSLGSCGDRGGAVRGSGTIEMDEIDVASLVGGRVLRLAVDEGDTVRAGDTLAVLTRGEMTADLAAQLAQAQRADAQARDLASGSRPAEVLVAEAALAAAQADRRLAESTFARTETLAALAVPSRRPTSTAARAVRDAAVAHERAAAEQLRLQQEGYRHGQVAAARQGATAAAAQLAGARSRASELVLTAPQDGVVLLRNFEPGELAPPNVAVLTLGDPEKLWMRVYVAAPRLGLVSPGRPRRGDGPSAQSSRSRAASCASPRRRSSHRAPRSPRRSRRTSCSA